MLARFFAGRDKHMRTLYSALMYLLVPLYLLRLLLRSLRSPAYRRRIPERFGMVALPPGTDLATPAIWVHAASVGEVQGAARLVESLLRQYPGHRLIVTTTTPTGAGRVHGLFGERVLHSYLPWDLPGALSRFLQRVRPELLLLMETELWPNLLWACERYGCHRVLVNGRLSTRSAARYQRVAPVMREAVSCLEAAACQTAGDAKRLIVLGSPANVVTVTGSLKFDVPLDDTERATARLLCRQLGLEGKPLWIAASTHSGEEDVVLDAHALIRQRHPDCLLLLAPRHPERFDAVAGQCRARGWHLARRSQAQLMERADVLLLDSIGELPHVFGAARVAFIGGGLVAQGGHNPVEAARWAVPVISGPQIENFAHAYGLLKGAGGALVVEEHQALAEAVSGLLGDPQRRDSMGRAAEQVVMTNRGALARTLAIVEKVLRPVEAGP